MTDNLIFGKWNSAGKKVIIHSTEEKSRDKHLKKEPYMLVVSSSQGQVLCSIQVHDTVFNIEFLDNLNRKYLRYRFREQDSGRLFLRGADFFEFEEKSDEVIKQTIFSFSTEGQLIITEFDYKTKNKTINKAKNSIDVSMLWTDYPEFGEYDDLIKIERLPKDINDSL